MLLHYLGKLKNQKFAIFMHVKTRFKWDFFIIYQTEKMPNVVKISAKINTMQNTNISLFVPSLPLTH